MSSEDLPSLIKLSRPFLTSSQIEGLLTEIAFDSSTFTQMLIQAFNTVLTVSQVYCKFPMKTISTALYLFQRTCLYNKFGSQGNKVPLTELTMACILTASKIQDTPKRCRNIITAVYQVRKTGPHVLTNQQIEEIKSRVLALERQILETISFDFRMRSPFDYILKVAYGVAEPKEPKEPKESEDYEKLAKLAWVICMDSYMTTLPLKFPSHTLALASNILAAKLMGLTRIFPVDSNRYSSSRTNVNAVLSDLLDFYIHNLRSSQLSRYYIQYDLARFMTFRIDINRELAQKPVQHKKQQPAQHIRDPKLSDKGSVRYIIEWETRHVKGELIG